MLKNNVNQLLEQANMSKYALSKACGFIAESGRINSIIVEGAIENKKITVENALKIYAVLKDAKVCETFEDVFFLDLQGLSIPVSPK